MLFGSKGILASAGISKILLLFGIFVSDCIRCKGLPRYWFDVMFLPEGFGGDESDNMYAEIRNTDDVIRVSKETQKFCLEHNESSESSKLMGLFVEEMTQNVLDHADQVNKKGIYVDFRLFANGENICFSMMDLSDSFDPTAFYEIHKEEYPEKHIGIGLVMKLAKEVRYFSALSSNNLIVYL
jgi:anti-sigma regulatory factor (Ser/Thr protein kinase)